MIAVTERAAAALQQMLAGSNVPPGQGVRVVPSGAGGLGMTIGPPNPGDEVIRRGEEPLLIIDSRVAALLDRAEIDCETAVVAGQQRTEFKLRPPV